MTLPVINGQSLLDDVRVRLGAITNAFIIEDLLSFINDGVQETWSILRSLDLDYSVDKSQDSDNTLDSFFADVTANTREYALPNDCREVRGIECLTTGYESMKFVYRNFSDTTFQADRRAATEAGANSNTAGNLDPFMFTTLGANTLMFAEYPPSTLKLQIWYVKAVPDLDVDTKLSDVLFPFSRKIVDYAVEKAMLSARQETLGDRWLAQWKDGVKTLATSAGPRVSTNPIFVTDFLG